MFGDGLVPMVLLGLELDFKIVFAQWQARQTGGLKNFAFRTLSTSSGILDLSLCMCVCVVSVCVSV